MARAQGLLERELRRGLTGRRLEGTTKPEHTDMPPPVKPAFTGLPPASTCRRLQFRANRFPTRRPEAQRVSGGATCGKRERQGRVWLFEIVVILAGRVALPESEMPASAVDFLGAAAREVRNTSIADQRFRPKPIATNVAAGGRKRPEVGHLSFCGTKLEMRKLREISRLKHGIPPPSHRDISVSVGVSRRCLHLSGS
jgi:hypothetical protein